MKFGKDRKGYVMAPLRTMGKKPSKPISPGFHIQRAMDALELTAEDVIRSSEGFLSIYELDMLISGRCIMNDRMALCLYSVLGHSEQFWLTVDHNCRVDRAAMVAHLRPRNTPEQIISESL